MRACRMLTCACAQLYLFPMRDVKLVMVGLDNAGKTTVRASAPAQQAGWARVLSAALAHAQVLYKLHLGEAVTTTPTVGSNVEQIQFRNLTFDVRPLWQTHLPESLAMLGQIGRACGGKG